MLSHVVCPLCGKNSSLRGFNPELLDLDVYVLSFAGLGRGLGFKSLGHKSILSSNNDTIGMIKERLLELLLLFKKKRILRPTEILLRLNLSQGSDILESLSEENLALKEENIELKRTISELESLTEDLSEESIDSTYESFE